ncbi:MAG: saccharopine dehydrogenase NADP-binding domain-containing protein [Actinomycetota bacterium]
MRIAVLGAGAMGRVASRLLGRRQDVDVVVVDADDDRAKKVAAEVGGEARTVDVSSGELAGALEGISAVASCLPYRLNVKAMEAALAAKCHYADLGGLYHMTKKQLELNDRFRDAGVSAVLGIGSAPGLTNVLARLGTDSLDRAVSVDLVDGAIQETGGFGVPYSAETVLDEFSLPSVVFENGELLEVPAGSGEMTWVFPEPLGELTAVFTLHSELATLPQAIPGLRDVRWRLALPPEIHSGFKLLTSIGLAGTAPVETKSGPIVPRDLLIALLQNLPEPVGPPSDVEVIDVRVSGEKGGRLASFAALLTLRPRDDLSAGAFGTALPITIATRWMAEGKIKPGVFPPETAFDPEPFLEEITAEGIGLKVRVEEDYSKSR